MNPFASSRGGRHKPAVINWFSALMMLALISGCTESAGFSHNANRNFPSRTSSSKSGLSSSDSSTQTTYKSGQNHFIPEPGLIALVADTYDDHLRMVNLATGRITESIQVGSNPYYIVVTPDRKKAYVANSGWGKKAQSQYTVSSIDLTNFRILSNIPVGTGPIYLAITPDGRTVLAADMGIYDSTDGQTMQDGTTITPINVSNDSAETPIHVGLGPGAIAITPDGKTAYVTLTGTPTNVLSEIVPVQLSDGTVGTPIPTGPAPMGIAITPDGNEALVANTGWPPNVPGNTVTPIDLRTGKAGNPIPAPPTPFLIDITPNGKLAFVIGSGSSGPFTTVLEEIDVASGQVLKSLQLPIESITLAISPDGSLAYVAGNVSPSTPSINTSTRPAEPGEIIPVEIASMTPLPPFTGIGTFPGAIAIIDNPASHTSG